MKALDATANEHEPAFLIPQVPALALVLFHDRHGDIRLWTTGMEQLYGFSKAQALGARSSDLLRSRRADPDDKIAEALLERGEWSGKVTNLTADGRQISVLVHRVRHQGADGQDYGASEFHHPLQTTALISEAQILLAEIAGSTADAIIGKTLDGIVTSWNQAAETIFGYSAAEMIGRPIDILAAPGREAEMPAILEALRRGERVRHLDTERRRKDGTIIHAAVTVSPIRDESGLPVGASEIARDITAARQNRLDLEEREARLSAIFESNPDGMIIVNHEGAIQSFSPVAEQIFGWSEAEAKGKSIGMLLSVPDGENHETNLRNYAATDRARRIGTGRVIMGQRKNGEIFPFELSVGEIRAGAALSYAGFIRDISNRRQTENRLRDAQAELMHVSRLSAMGQMAAMLAHELNQPLTAITNYMRAGRRLLETSGSPPLGKLRDALDRAGDEALRAGQVIKRLRGFMSRNQTEKRIEPIAEVIEEARALALVGARHRAMRITLPAPPPTALVLIDRVQIHQVLLNLLRNSLEATGERAGRIEIATASHGQEIEVSVADQGTGISPEIAARLFEPFVTSKQTGMGIGLSICRSIIEAHGGRLWNEPNPDGGTIFRFTLPLAEKPDTVDG